MGWDSVGCVHALSSDHGERVVGVLLLQVLPQVAQVVEAIQVNSRTRGRLARRVLLVADERAQAALRVDHVGLVAESLEDGLAHPEEVPQLALVLCHAVCHNGS